MTVMRLLLAGAEVTEAELDAITCGKANGWQQSDEQQSGAMAVTGPWKQGPMLHCSALSY
jgi:hypothetical protein